MRVVAPDQFVGAMRHAAAAVTVVTSADRDGNGAAGSTVSAMCSVSAEPPSLLICLNRSGSLAPALSQHDTFCVNLLSADQLGVAECFAGRVPDLAKDRFRCGRWTRLVTGSPVLIGAQASFDCRVLAEQTVGTHVIIVGSVMGVCVTPADPLLYHNCEYRNLLPSAGMT